MKKTIIKSVIVAAVFFFALFAVSSVLNTGNTDMTMEMSRASFPMVSVSYGGYRINRMFGYSDVMETSQMRESITPLAAMRKLSLVIEPCGTPIQEVSFEVRTVDGSRLIENTTLTEFEQKENYWEIPIQIKDLIQENQEYELVVLLTLENSSQIRYYSRIIYPEEYHVTDKLDYVVDFSNRTFDKEAAKSLVKYLESNEEGDNTTFGRVNIHSSFQQITWGGLQVIRETEPEITIQELAPQTGSFVLEYFVSTPNGSGKDYYRVREYYRIRYTEERIYLLDYERTMNQIFDEKADVYINNKIMLGITGEEQQLVESDGGGVISFVTDGRLFSYNVADNKLARLFAFYDEENQDGRCLNNNHKIRILNTDEGGNVIFLVYGYMNRGRHEGEVGVSAYHYDSTVNTIEEMLYIPCKESAQLVMEEADQLSYVNKNSVLYLKWRNQIYGIQMQDRRCQAVVEELAEGSYKVSDSNRMLVWQTGGKLYQSRELILMNLTTGEQKSIQGGRRELIAPIGFMGEDLIYGIARKEDVVTDYTGKTVFPMYCVRIEDEWGKILMNYRQDGVYVTAGEISDNQIVLSRVVKEEDGSYTEITEDQIMNAKDPEIQKNHLEEAVTENYEKLTQIALKEEIDAAALKHLTPKEVLFEGGRDVVLGNGETPSERFFVYGKNGVEKICGEPGEAVNLADEISGVVIGERGNYLWKKGNRRQRNQIMAITGELQTEERSSLAVCLDVMLTYKGIVRNSQYMLNHGKSARSILSEGMENAQILDLTGCTLDAVLYYVNQDIPVLVRVMDGSAVLLIGFNESQVVIMNPEDGTVSKMGMTDAREWFEENGNCFITYVRVEQ